MTTPDLTTLPTTHWHHTPHDTTTHLTPTHTGIHLGTTPNGTPITLPTPAPTTTRIAVLGESLFARLITLRLLAVGTHVTAITRVPDKWHTLRHAAANRLHLTNNPTTWPPHHPTPPTTTPGPQALITDRRHPPPTTAATGPWHTLIHVTHTTPRHTAFWTHPDALLALHPTHADQIAPLLGPKAAELTAQLTPGEIILFRPTTTQVLRLDLSPGETAILTPGSQPR